MPALPPPAPLPIHGSKKNTSPVSVELSSPFPTFQNSFTSSDGFHDEMGGSTHALYSNAGALGQEQTSPASSHSQSHSPGSSIHPSVLSGGSNPTSPIGLTAGSPAYAPPQFVNGELTLSPGIEELDSSSRRMSLNHGAPSPFLPDSSVNVNSSMMYTHGAHHQQQQAQHLPTYTPTQLSQNQQFAYGMNPALQHQMMMQLQVQQTAQLQHQQVHYQHPMHPHAEHQLDTGMFGLNGGLNWNAFGGGIGVDGGLGGDAGGFAYMV